MVEPNSDGWRGIFAALKIKDLATAHAHLKHVQGDAPLEVCGLALHLQAHLLYGAHRLEEASAALENAAGEKVERVTGDFFDSSVCPGPYDVVMERCAVHKEVSHALRRQVRGPSLLLKSAANAGAVIRRRRA